VDRAAWNELAANFEELVCDVAREETNDRLRHFVSATRPSPRSSVLVDLGCGIGTFIKRFGPLFKEIVAVEYAPKTIARAKERCAGMANVAWMTMDVARAAKKIGTRADLTVCLHVITSASTAVRNAQWAGVVSVTKPGGFALVVVPSLESEEMIQDHISRGMQGVKSKMMASGLVEVDGTRQKYYRRDEVAATVAKHGLKVVRLDRIVSSWSREGMAKPRSGNREGPWDWICLAQRPA
jgi:SAM-dependent methyltransferase